MDFICLGSPRDKHEYRIYGGADLEVYAVVDAQDYTILTRHKWLTKPSRTGQNFYLFRNQQRLTAPEGSKYESPITGKLVRGRNRVQMNTFLHHDVMRLAGRPRPSDGHLLDHRDGNGLNCRRHNLRWVSTLFNFWNKRGVLRDADETEFDRLMLEWPPDQRSQLAKSWALSQPSPAKSRRRLVQR